MQNIRSKERNGLIGKELRRQRRMQDRTLQDVASAVGMKENTISAYEKGKIQIPIDSLEAVCSYLGINFIDLLYDVQRQIEEMPS